MNLQNVTLNLANGITASDSAGSKNDTFNCGGSSAILTGGASVTCATSTLDVAGANLTGSLTAGTATLSTSGDALIMSNGTTANIAPSQTENLTCGNLSGTVAATATGASALCTITGGVGALTDTSTGATLTLTGTGAANIDGNSNLASQAAGITATFDGTSNTDALAAGAIANLAGSGSSLTATGSSATVEFLGTTQTITLNGSNNSVTDGLNISGGTLNATGSGNLFGLTSTSINLGAGSSGTATGNGNQFTGAAATALTVNGTGETVHDAAGDVLTLAANGGVTYYGSGAVAGSDTVNAGSGATVTLDSGASIVAGSGLTAITLAANIGQTNIVGTNDPFTAGAKDLVCVQGGGDVGTASAGAIIDFVQGTGALADTCNGSGITVENGSGVDLTVTGSNDVVAFNGDPGGGAGTTTTLNGTGETAYAAAGDTFNLAANGGVTFYGSGSVAGSDTIDAAAGAAVSLASGANIVAGSGLTAITLAANIGQTNVEGTNDPFTAGAKDLVCVQGGGDVGTASAGAIIDFVQGTGTLADTCNGSGITVENGTNVNLTVTGSYDVVAFNGDTGGGAGTTTNISGTGETAYAAAGDLFNLGAKSGMTFYDSGSVAGSDTIDAAAGDAVSLASGASIISGSGLTAITLAANIGQTNIVGSNDPFTAGAKDLVCVQGGGDVGTGSAGAVVDFVQGALTLADTFSGSGATVENGTNVNLTVTGSNLIVAFNGDPNGGAGTTTTLTGTNETDYAAAHSTLDLGANTSAAVNGASVGVLLSSGDAVTIAGSATTVSDDSGVTGGAVTFDGAGGFASLAGAAVTLGTSGATTTVGGQNDVTTAGSSVANEILVLAGQGQTADVSNASQVDFVEGSTGGVLNGSNNGVPLGTGVGVKVSGANDDIYWNGDTGGGGGTSALVTGTGITDSLSNGSLILGSSATSVALTGAGMTASDATGVTGGTLTASGTNTYDVTGGLISLANGVGATDNGANNTFDATNSTLTLASNIGQVTASGTEITIDAGTGDDTGQISVSGSTGTDIVNWSGGDSVGAASWSVAFNPNAQTQDQITDWTDAGATGPRLDQLDNWTAGGSQVTWYDPEAGVSQVLANYAGADQSGNVTTEDLTTTGGDNEDFTFQYNPSSQLTGAVEDYYSPSGTFEGDADFNSSGQETYSSGDAGSFGEYFGGYDLSVSSVTAGGARKGANISQISAWDVGHGQIGAAAAAQAASFQAGLTALSPASAGILSPSVTTARWSGGVITWSFGVGAGTVASPFSGAIGAQYQSLVEGAFAAWAAATGLKFMEVADSAAADIRIGWGDFGTATSGVLGYTASPVKSGALQAGAVIRLEDPSQLALTAGAGGQPSYAGTNAELSQVILHEIGHAIGLGDSADPGSIMYSVAGAGDRVIAASDVAAVGALYSQAPGSAVGPAPVAGASSSAVNLLVQSMAGHLVSPVAVASDPSGNSSLQPVSIALAGGGPPAWSNPSRMHASSMFG